VIRWRISKLKPDPGEEKLAQIAEVKAESRIKGRVQSGELTLPPILPSALNSTLCSLP